MTEINNMHDKFFKNVFGDVENTKTFLKKALPTPIRDAVDFSTISIDTTNDVSQQFKEVFSDIVAKTKMQNAFRNDSEAIPEISRFWQEKDKTKWTKSVNVKPVKNTRIRRKSGAR